MAEFFDTGYSRTLPWARRPQAAALVAALADPDRGWDAIAIGEYERAFSGGQYASMAPLFEHYGLRPSLGPGSVGRLADRQRWSSDLVGFQWCADGVCARHERRLGLLLRPI